MTTSRDWMGCLKSSRKKSSTALDESLIWVIQSSAALLSCLAWREVKLVKKIGMNCISCMLHRWCMLEMGTKRQTIRLCWKYNWNVNYHSINWYWSIPQKYQMKYFCFSDWFMFILQKHKLIYVYSSETPTDICLFFRRIKGYMFLFQKHQIIFHRLILQTMNKSTVILMELF